MNIRLKYDGAVADLTLEQIQLIEEFIVLCPYVVIGTNHEEWGVRLSALTNLPGQSLRKFYFVTPLRSQKAVNILGDPRCEIMMVLPDSGQLIIGGNVELVSDKKTKRSYWQSWMCPLYPEGPEDENFCLVSLLPETLRCDLW